ncbi:aspartic peptidase domain-containing protein [Apodospora peruviana]|uniref:Aspartic peptidase domain-containing protein n=1 Tax=Apodospora peruviana TaxID=516989 RepID=A0AAE0I557_9PEZI|nr:aspartic peptidase domain-containing protein [Apodospora peruviana]
MRLPFLVAAVVCDILLLSAPLLVAAADAPSSQALWIQPSTTWYGIDGTWSNFMFAVGSPAQLVYLTVATALSELWLVESGGCPPLPICTDARGGVFEIGASETWRSLGPWQLGMNYTGMGGNGNYGLETVAFVNTVTRFTSSVDGALVATLNDTNYYQGYVGVGVTQGKFGTNITNPFISQLAETYGVIPSHSYGYTAGAYYRNTGKSNGTFASLTLGGYDTLRLVPHDTQFYLDPVSRLPKLLLRGVTAKVPSLDKAPSNWTSTSQALVNMGDSITALIDSSTPYLWLPTEVCDRFATALNLTWKEDLGVYTFSSYAQYIRFQTDESLSFTFSVSSYEKVDDFGQPLDLPGVVNITLPAAAFAQVLRYPFKNVIQWGEQNIPYFPLKRSSKEVNDNQYIIGRAFMQEAYIITNYDSGIFSLHQALFPEDSANNYTLQTIQRPPDSPYPDFKQDTSGGGGLSAGKTAGIVLSAFASGSVIGFVLWCLCRRRKRSKKDTREPTEKNKEESNSDEGEQPRSPVKRMFSIIVRRKKSKKPLVHEVHGSSAQPVEVGADAHHQLFELPVPPEPVELDCNDIGDDDTDLGGDSSHGLSEYEITRRKMERQLQGPVPTYSPSATDHDYSPSSANHEKSMQDISAVGHYRPSDEPSPASSPTYANSNSLPESLPSPLSPHPDWTVTRHFDLPSPMTVAPSFHPFPPPSSSTDPGSSYSPVSPHSSQSPQTYVPSTISRSDSSNISPTSPAGSVGSLRSLRMTTPAYQRTPIDPSRVICLGPLPENVEFPVQQPPIPRIITPDGRITEREPPLTHPQDSSLRTGSLKRSSSASRGSNETLGSNFTVEEETRIQEEVVRHVSRRQPEETEGEHYFPRSPRSMERIEAGSELVHVPQVADKRYSWEENDDR